jgi:hypothetical protein
MYAGTPPALAAHTPGSSALKNAHLNMKWLQFLGNFAITITHDAEERQDNAYAGASQNPPPGIAVANKTGQPSD